jgi:hypothetical protein
LLHVEASGGSDGAAVDHVLGTSDRRGTVTHKERDELGNFVGLGGSAERDATEGRHELVQRSFAGDAIFSNC